MTTSIPSALRVASYSRYSTELQDDSSLTQQQKRCQEKAIQLGMTISLELEFSDAHLSGTIPDRAGLQKLMHAAESGLIDVVIVDSLSRLSRELSHTLTILKNLIQVHGVRVISVTENIDSSLGNWEIQSVFSGYMNQEYIKALGAAVVRGQSHAHLNGYSTGTFPFGYKSVAKEGTEYGRQRKLRKEILIHEDHAQWARKVFDWFVKDKMPIQKIAKELTRLKAPKDHRSSVSHWNHQSVSHLLTNKHYIGVCTYGKKTNVRNPLTGKVSQKLRPAEESSKWIIQRDDLKIVNQDIFDQAQAILEDNRERFASKRGKKGRFKGATNDIQNPRHLLQGLFVCDKCKSQFITRGYEYMQCRGSIKGVCDVITCLPRTIAKKMIIGELQRSLEKDQPLMECLFETLKKSIEARKRNHPNEQEALTKELKAASLKVTRLLELYEDLKGDDPEGQKDLRDKLKSRTQEKNKLEKELAKLAGNPDKNLPEPTLPLVQDKLNFIVNAVVNGTLPKTSLTNIIGTISLIEVETIGLKRKHFAGLLKLETSRLLSLITDGKEILSDSCDEEVLLNFIPESEWLGFKDPILELHSKGMKHREIGKALGCPRNWVTLALKHHADASGVPYVDGRKLKKRLDKPTMPMKIADQAKAMMDEGLLLQEIAKKLGCGRDMITAAIKHWHTSRGLAVPDGRTRRKSLERKSSKKGSD